MNQPLPNLPYNQVLVTGASRGLGRALVRGLLARGHSVVLTARPGSALEEAAALLCAEHGNRVNWIGADLADPAVAQTLVQTVEMRFGTLDAVINNAGIGAWKPLIEWSAQEVISCVNLNLVAPMLLAQAALPGMMARRRGLIVNIASDLARRPLANMACSAFRVRCCAKPKHMASRSVPCCQASSIPPSMARSKAARKKPGRCAPVRSRTRC